MNANVGAAARAAFEGLIDYAGLYPPAELSMQDAVAEYAGSRSISATWMLGRFIVAASRAAEAAAVWDAHGNAQPLALSVIVDADRDPRRWFASLQRVVDGVARMRAESSHAAIDVLEVPLPPPPSARDTFDAPIGQLRASLDRAGLGALPAYVELPTGPRYGELLSGAMVALGRTHLGAKIRCGGVVAEAFPTVDAVADFIATAAAHGVPFKATAGLHHPVRHRDPATGFVMHGFLNLLAAATFAPGAGEAELRGIVAEEDADAFAFDAATFTFRSKSATADDVKRMRANAFIAYGSCSFSEPVDDLAALRILPAASSIA